MAELRVISAGAGTGKTHRLAEELFAALTADIDPVTPESVVAVTYTRSAAAELETRVRTRLIDGGRLDLARRLAAARIGTVHGVCARLIEEHAFTLGLPPELETVDDVVAAGLFEDALAASITDAERQSLDELEQRFALGPDARGFLKNVRDVVDQARHHEFSDDDLAHSCDVSVDSLLQNLPPPRPAAEVEASLLVAMKTVIAGAGDRGSTNWRDAVDELRRSVMRLEHGGSLSWSEWLSLSDTRFPAVSTAAQFHVEHQQLHDDLAQMSRLVFAVARRTMQRYEADKRAAGVVDFTDQEQLALQAVQHPAVQAALRADVHLLLVDEFQDTSPLQMRLFDALRRVAVRTIFVGDDKQSIFGFRNARPELFVAMAGQAEHRDRLSVSYRSRPGLVSAVSAIFAAGFAGHRRAEDVVLTASLSVEPPGLGAHVERWTAMTDSAQFGERVPDEDVIAAGVAEALSTRDIPVRPLSAGDDAIRPAQARDIAVLCRYNSNCRKVARALHRRGIPVSLGRQGLSKTFEARVLSAALALWLDPTDALARLTVVHLLDPQQSPAGPKTPQQRRNDDDDDDDDDDDVKHLTTSLNLLAEVASQPRGEALTTHPLVLAVTTAATANPHAGLIFAIDRIVDVLRLTDHLGGLGAPAQRLADLAALRALAVRFVDECFARGRGPTITGYLDRLETLRHATRDDDVSDDDNRGAVAGEDAVTVTTYHRAKGKEWPVVILATLYFDPWISVFDTVVETTLVLPDLARPSFGHTLRCWPTPYGGSAKHGIVKALKGSPIVERAERAAFEEARRLVYVGFTRARDRIIVIGDHTIWARGHMKTLCVDGRPLCCDPPGEVGVARWAGVDVNMAIHHPWMQARLTRRNETLVMPERDTGPRPVRAPAFQQPSAQEGTGVAGESVLLGPTVMVGATTRDELNPLGQCVHAFLAWDAFATDISATGVARRRLKAKDMLERFAVDTAATVTQLVAIADRLWSATDARFPGLRRRTEVPMLHRVPAGSLMRGQLDLLLDGVDDDGKRVAVIIDHKTTWDPDVTGYAGQLRAYSQAVVAAGTPSVSTWIHLPLLGQLVEVVATAPMTPTTTTATTTTTTTES